MEPKTPPKDDQKSEAPKEAPKPQAQANPKPVGAPTEKPKRPKRYFKKTTYIKGFGIVNAGDELTGEMLKAWTQNTPVKIDAYVGKKVEVLKELPKSDKQKLADYEAQNKD